MVLMRILGFIMLYVLLAAGNVRYPQATHQVADPTFYDSLEVTPEVWVPQLPEEIDESSGLMVWDGLVWTLNDSGGTEDIFGLDPVTGQLKKTIHIRNAKNRDWESLTGDEDHIYIGDFGNNWGRRKDLGVWIIEKADIPDTAACTVEASWLHFSYPEQTSYFPALYHSHFDCEAMVAGGGKLYLFTKDWVNRKTYLYRLPATPGNYKAELLDSCNVHGLITGAAWDAQRNLLALSGYENFYPLVWVFSGFSGHDFFSHRVVRVSFPEFYGAQTEGIVFWKTDDLLISSEKTKLEGAIYHFNLHQLLKNP